MIHSRLALGVMIPLMVAVPAAPRAMTFEERTVGEDRVLLARGDIVPGDGNRFIQALNRAGAIGEVWLSSDGGSLFEGLKIGRHLRKAGIATRVPDGEDCASACAYAFLGGVLRAVDPRGRIGVHMTASHVDPELVALITAIIVKHGPAGARIIIPHVEQQAALAAAAQAKYLVEMTVSLELMTPITDTLSSKIHWLTRTELKRYNVVNQ